MTELTFLEKSYLKELETTVDDITPDGIVTSETIFYPRSGGQDGDKGYVEWNGQKFEVLEVEKIEHDVLLKIGEHEIKEGDKVHLFIEWERRYKLMKYHTAAHILSEIVYKRTGALITGNNLDVNKGRIDFDLEDFNRDEIDKYEEEANEIVEEGKEVKIYSLEREEAMKIDSIFKLRDVLPKSITKFRIVDIEGLDRQACGGTHVKKTKEIGHISVVKAENKGKNNKRLYFEI